MEKTFETEVLTRLTAIETKLDDYKGIKEKAEKAYTLSADNKEEIKQIKDNNKWLFRTTIGAIITGLISIGLAFFKGGN
jgi:uncharacterized pyridoxamine 5'-phosphate oxidase family protein